MAGAAAKDRVVIAVDPHKASWTAAAVDASLQPIDINRVPVSREGSRTTVAGTSPAAGAIPAGPSKVRPEWAPH